MDRNGIDWAKITEEQAALCPVHDPSPIAFFNVYEPGDVWVKVVGCEGCESTDKCCGNCPLLIEAGCLLHVQNRGYSRKPFSCVVRPHPGVHIGHCQQVWRCVKGSKKGFVRHLNKPANVFDED